MIRDSILFISGRLNPERGGPSVFPPLPDDLADFARYGRTGRMMWEPNETEADGRRRSVYIFQRRSLPLPMMAAFDAPVFSESCSRRSVTTTPLQALSLLNGSMVRDASQALARRIEAEAGSDRRAQVVRACLRVLNREPDPEETGGLSRVPGLARKPLPGSLQYERVLVRRLIRRGDPCEPVAGRDALVHETAITPELLPRAGGTRPVRAARERPGSGRDRRGQPRQIRFRRGRRSSRPRRSAASSCSWKGA